MTGLAEDWCLRIDLCFLRRSPRPADRFGGLQLCARLKTPDHACRLWADLDFDTGETQSRVPGTRARSICSAMGAVVVEALAIARFSLP